MRAFVLSRQKFPFITLFIGIFLGLFVVLDPFITNIIVCKIELTIPILNKNIFKLYPYEISSFLFLIIIISIYIKKLAAYIFLNSEKAFLVLYLIGVQTIALTRVGRIDSSEIIVIVFLLLFAVKYMVVHKKVTVTPFDLMNLLFTISVLLPTFNNGRLFDFLSTVLTVSKLLFIGFLLVTCIENKDNMIFFLKWFVIITGVSSVIAILQEIAYIVLGIPIVGFVDREALRLMIEPTSFGNFLRVPAFLGSYKAFTFFANTAALIIFNYFLYKKLLSIKRRSILIISFLLILISIFLTFSKDAYLALFIGLVLSVLIWRPYFIFHLFFCQLEHKIRREPAQVPFDCLNQTPGINAVKRGEVGVQQHLLAPDKKDRPLDPLDRHKSGLGHLALLSEAIHPVSGWQVTPWDRAIPKLIIYNLLKVFTLES